MRARNSDSGQVGDLPGGNLLNSPAAIKHAARVASIYSFMTAGVIAVIAAHVGKFDAVTIGMLAFTVAWATALPLLPWHRRSHNWLAKAYLVGAATFIAAAWHFEHSYILFGVFPDLIALANIYWYRRSARLLHFGGLFAAFVISAILIPDGDLATLFIACPILGLTALVIGSSGDRMLRASLSRKRFESTVKSLLGALYMRDGYTGEHSEVTVTLATAVADELKLTESERKDLADVAVLHDIGKIGIPNAILQKPGKLDDAEWETMATHPIIGEQILRDVPGFSEVARAIRHEHERWDGLGYPDGIAGTDIPLASRVVLACDAYHAMVSDRPYRKAMSSDEARDELMRHSGSQFDPIIVGALVNVIDSGIVSQSEPPSRLASENSTDAEVVELFNHTASPVVQLPASNGAAVAPPAARNDAETQSDKPNLEIPGAVRARAAMSIVSWTFAAIVMSLYMVFTEFRWEGAAVVAVSVATLSATAALRATAPRPWIFWTGMLAFLIMPLAAWRLDEPVLLLCLLVPAIGTTAIAWTHPIARAGVIGLLGIDFLLVPILIMGGEGLPFAAVSARAFPGVIIVCAILLPRLREVQFDRQRFSGTMNSLLQALQARDGYTGDHSHETVALALKVADELGLDETARGELNDVALLHDIGKIGIPDEVLHKPGKLTDEEWTIMRRHPAIGEQIVVSIPGFQSIAKAIRHEHERWDGKGYPDGLRSTEIPIASRIVFVCDAFHAMTSDRPYRAALGTEVACEELAKNAGTQFDPIVVEALLTALIDESASPSRSADSARLATAAAG
ncbi:MAG TPA: HD-GYP domain-containing protein [Solirubrobacterales bacterium]|jgi:HD-GYP domain-containing protein (c-di-GMP phosphodiesterase class II)|nr:HD-GYP domain-containing protein [Solirubrobacterales bacterium]